LACSYCTCFFFWIVLCVLILCNKDDDDDDISLYCWCSTPWSRRHSLIHGAFNIDLLWFDSVAVAVYSFSDKRRSVVINEVDSDELCVATARWRVILTSNSSNTSPAFLPQCHPQNIIRFIVRLLLSVVCTYSVVLLTTRPGLRSCLYF